VTPGHALFTLFVFRNKAYLLVEISQHYGALNEISTAKGRQTNHGDVTFTRFAVQGSETEQKADVARWTAYPPRPSR